MNIDEIKASIEMADAQSLKKATERWNAIAHPLHSLGKLEDVVVKLSGIYRTSERLDIEKKAHVIMCGDNGVVEEGVSQSGYEVTAIVANNFVDIKSSVSIMCNKLGVSLFPIDIGMKTDTKIPKMKIAYGTKNMTKEPPMTREEAMQGISIGIDMVKKLKEEGYKVIGTGEMGIGNTTTSSAVAAVLLGKDIVEVTGKGAGLSDEGLKRKISAIRKAIEVNQPNREDPVDVLGKVGGFDIAGLTESFWEERFINFRLLLMVLFLPLQRLWQFE
jgi:nicotinate-nucleotide--dimethylbenzimidazole phosphoribosyltransferase